MNKKIFTILILLCLGSVSILSAREISQKEAEKVAKNFFYEMKANERLSYDQMIIEESFSSLREGTVVYYAFNFQNGGFVIVSADDSYYPILGYSDTNIFKEDGAPENFKAWMNGYAEDIKAAKNSKKPSEHLEKWNHLLTDDITLLNRATLEDVVFLDAPIWDQNSPYNYYAPSTPNGSGPDGKCYAGCVSTSMLMCMYYWRWPFVGEGSHSYVAHSYSQNHPMWSWGTLSANFAESYYDWYGTVHTPGNGFFKDISYAMYHCGIAVEMTYDPEGSGAFSADVPYAIKTYFKYATNAAYQSRGNATAWINMLKQELDNGRMLYYSGTSSSGGHAFICDGYNTDDHFHFNWGWSGYGNGYYSVAVGPDGYNANQGTIKNFQPNPNKGYPYYCEGETVVSHIRGSIEDGSGPVANYLDNANASWLIDPTVAGDSVTSYTIDIKRLDLSTGDWLRIYAGSDANGELIKEYTEHSLKESVTVNNGKVYITFTSDGFGTANGFLIEFSGNAKKYCSGNNFIDNYEGIITDGSPEDLNYAHNTNCMYIFNGNKDLDWIKFSFKRCRLAEGDEIIIRKENAVITTITGIYEGVLPQDILIENLGTEMVAILFSTDNKFNEKGWEIEYTTNKTGIEEFEAVTDLSVFPNPANRVVNVNFETERTTVLEVSLYSVTGQLLQQNKMFDFSGNYLNTINVQDYTQGVYILSIRTDRGISTRKIIVQ